MTTVAKIVPAEDILLTQLEQKSASNVKASTNPISTGGLGENTFVETNFSDPLLDCATLPYMQKYSALEQELAQLRRKQQELMLRAANCKESEERAQIQKQAEELGVQIEECQANIDVLIAEMQIAAYSTSYDTGNISGISGNFGGLIAGGGFSGLTGVGKAIVDVAKRYMGYNEADGSYRLFTKGRDYAWCAAFVSYVVKQAYKEMGKSVPKGFGSSSVSTLMSWGIKNDLFLKTAGMSNSQKAAAIAGSVKAGDLVIFKSNGASHVGIIKSVNADGTFTTIEGNSSDRVKSNKFKPGKNTITGFIRMA